MESISALAFLNRMRLLRSLSTSSRSPTRSPHHHCRCQVDAGVYKNLLQELSQKEGCSLPVYHTVSSGPPHLPIFVCTVEIEGETFSGTPAKSKKQAENFAAKVAWCYHEERKLSRMSATSSQDQESNGFSCLLQSAVTGDLCKSGSLIVNSIQSNSPIISSKGASSRVSGNLSTLIQTQAALEKVSVAPSVSSESLQNHKPIGNSSATQTIKSLSVN